MEGSIKDLADIRFEKACEILKSAQSNLELGGYPSSYPLGYPSGYSFTARKFV